MRLPRRQSEKLKIWDSGPIYLTEDGLARLRASLDRLKRELPSLIAEAERTAAYGDRSDNAEYKDAKSNLRRARWSILSIQEQLKRVEIIIPGPGVSGAIRLGSTVALEVNGVKKTFQILGPRETDPGRGYISHESPLGVALIGRVAGDEIVIPTARGGQKYRILEVR